MPSQERRVVSVTMTSRTVWRVMLNVIAIALLAGLVYATRRAIFAVVVALLITVAVNPVVKWLERRRISRPLAVVLLCGGGILLLGLLVLAFLPMFIEQGGNFINNAPDMLERLMQRPLVQRLNERFHLKETVMKIFSGESGNAAKKAFGMLGSVIGVVRDLITIAVLTVFMLIFGGDVVSHGLQGLEAHQRRRFLSVSGRMQDKVGGYVLGTLFIAAIGGVIIGAVLAILQVPYWLPLGVLMIILGIIPYLGPIIGAVLIVGATMGIKGFGPGVIMAVVFVGYQIIENNLLQPLVQNRTIKMNPLIIVLVLLIGASLMGVVGALLALPVAGAAQVLLEDVFAQHRANSKSH